MRVKFVNGGGESRAFVFVLERGIFYVMFKVGSFRISEFCRISIVVWEGDVVGAGVVVGFRFNFLGTYGV